MIKIIYHTPSYHKLCEKTARLCYQSEDKITGSSHRFLRGIMQAGHVSVASVGNMVFEIDHTGYDWVFDDLAHMQELNMFIKWTSPYTSRNGSSRLLVSMNMLTFMDLYKGIDMNNDHNEIFYFMLEEVNKVPELRWFYDKTVELPESENIYAAKGCPKLYEPIVLDEDYTKLKALGLNDYELGIHATITMNFVTDRSTSLQLWRHGASTGGCELSQRYVERGNAEYREMINIGEQIQAELNYINGELTEIYEWLLEKCEERGIRKGRAKEISRSILPNAITTQLIQCRTYRNWMHLFRLRDDKHAQVECQEDVRAIKRALTDIGVKVD